MVAKPESRSLSTKVLDVLGCFDDDHRRLTLSEISRRTGISLTTTHRIVGDLNAWGALERGSDGRLGVGLRLWEVAALAQRGLPLREIALPYMEDLYEATHENIQLAVREDLEIVYIERIAGSRAVKVLTRVGGRFALHATGVGLVLLAYAPQEVQERVLDAELERWTDMTITDPTTLRASLADVRRNGFAVSRSQVTMDALSLACPIRSREDTVVAALSVVVHADLEYPLGLLPSLRAASRSISRALGSPSARIHPPRG